MKRRAIIFAAAGVAALTLGCIKLDFFLFVTTPAESVAADYHGLPLYQGTNVPSWVRAVTPEREVYLRVPDGAPIASDALDAAAEYLHGAFIPAPATCPADTCPLGGENITFLYLHGNSGSLWDYWYRAVALWSMGANVFVFTYRGYGMSRGEATRANVLQDVDAAASYVKQRAGVDSTRIVVYGYSMGGVPASYLAGESPRHRNTFAGVVVEAGLDAPEETVRLSTGTDFPDGFFLDDTPFNGPEFIRGTTMPVLHLHGANDQRVIPDQARKYYDVLAGRANYSYNIGGSGNIDAPWLTAAGHRTIPTHAFGVDTKISNLWDDPDNPSHCCVHPLEYAEPQYASFLESVGSTTGQAMVESAMEYQSVVVQWIDSILP